MAHHKSAPASSTPPRSLSRAQQLQHVDDREASPLVRATWTLHCDGRGAHQKITPKYMDVFIDVADRELAAGRTVEEAELVAGEYALNAALDERAAFLRGKKRQPN